MKEIDALCEELLPVLKEELRLERVKDEINQRACTTAAKVVAALRRQVSAGDDDPGIEVLDLSARVYNLLRRRRFQTVGGLLAQAADDGYLIGGIRGIDGIGAKAAAEINAALRACGFAERLG